ncbi:MAG: hypothetical protein PHI18_02020 [bacterium]|nr:hypothetical protein [bacterium]
MNVPPRSWSGPAELRTSYRGPEPGSRECGAASFSVFHPVRKVPPNWMLHLDGVDDVAEIPAALMPVFPAVMTVCFWGRRHSAIGGSLERILSHADGGGPLIWAVADSPLGAANKLRFRQSTDGVNFQTSILTDEITDTELHCLIARNDGSAAQWYLDNAASGSADSSPATGNLNFDDDVTGASRTRLSIGATWHRALSQYLYFAKWDLDDVRIFGRALSAGERSRYYNGGTGLYEALGGELIWFRCNEGAGSELVDASGNGRNAQVAGASWIGSSLAQGPSQNLLVKGSLVTIAKHGQRRFRGRISQVETPKWKIEIQTVEAAAAVNEQDANSPVLGGQSNPGAVWYWNEGRYFEARTPESLPGLGAKLAYTEESLFDSYEWTRGPGNMEGQRFRGCVWREETIETLLTRLKGLADLSIPGLISSVAAATEHDAKSSLQAVQVEQGDTIEPVWTTEEEVMYPQPWGLVTRTIAGATCTFYWRYKGGYLELYQIVNHGRAELLGIRRLDWLNNTPPLIAVQFTDPTIPASRTLGPFELTVPEFEASKLVFAIYGYTPEYNDMGPPQLIGNRHLGRVWTVDLAQRKQYGEGRELEVAVQELNLVSNTIYNYVAYNASSGYFEFTDTPQTLWKHKSKRADGEYTDLGQQYQIYWQGDVWLREMAGDARGQTIGAILREICLLCGCEWWIDGDGVLRMERMDRAARTAEISGVRIITDVPISRAAGEPFADISPATIPLNDYSAALIKTHLNRIAAAASGEARRIQVRSPEHRALDLSLGALLTINGVRAGKIVAVNGDRYTETIEVEPLPNEPARAIA